MLVKHYNGTSVKRSQLEHGTTLTSGVLVGLGSLKLLRWSDGGHALHDVRHEAFLRILLGEKRVVRDSC